MRIFYSQNNDPMLLDTATKLNVLYEKINEFLDSDLEHMSFPAIVTLSPAPYQELLNGLRIQKNNGYVKLLLSESRWLELTGSVGNQNSTLVTSTLRNQSRIITITQSMEPTEVTVST